MDDTDRAQRVANWYRSVGLSPLPSRRDSKRPDLSEFTTNQSEPLCQERFDDWRTTNIQLMCGHAAYGTTKLVVVDLDGYQAELVWAEMCKKHGGHEDTWEVRTGGGGRHIYFLASPHLKGATVAPFKSGILWGVWDTWGQDGRGEWLKHKFVQILGDGALAVAPPSLHVETGTRYEFIDRHCPKTISLPADMPGWLASMPRLGKPRFFHDDVERKKEIVKPSGEWRGRMGRSDVLALIDDKLSLAESWGLRTSSGSPNQNGWISCRAVGREDRNPSASFSPQTGAYHDCRESKTMSLFDLGVALGQFSTWQDAMRWCEEKYARP